MRISRWLPVAAALVFTGCLGELDLPPAQRGVLRGSVESGLTPADGQPVTLVRPSGARQVTTTETDGAFVFDDLPPGQYTLKLDLPGFAPLVEAATVLSGQTVEVPPLRPVRLPEGNEPDGTVRGVIAPPMGLTGVAGATVEFRKEGQANATALSAVGFDGAFIVRVPGGRYRLLASHPSFTSATMTDLDVDAGVDLTIRTLQLGLDPATLSGLALVEVDGAAAAPADDTFVTVEPFGATTRANPLTGEWTLGGLPPGDYRLRIEHAGATQPGGPGSFTVARAQSVDAGITTLALDRGTLQGSVQMGDNLTSDGVSVSITGTGYGAVVSPSATNPALGSFRIAGVPVGAMKEVVARKQGYLQATRGGLTVTANATTDLGLLQLAVQQGQFVIDDGDPSVLPDFTRTRNVTIGLTAPGAVRMRVSEDPTFTGVAFVPFTGAPVPFTLSDADGLHPVYVQSEDALNIQSPTLSASVLLDRVAPAAPRLSIQSGAAFTSQTQLLALTLEGTEGSVGGPPVAGLAQMRISASSAVDGNGLLMASPVPYQRDTVFVRTVTTDGAQAVSMQLVDRAGNASVVVTSSIVIDSQPPSGSIAIQNGVRATVAGFTDSSTVTLTLGAASEPNGGFVLMRLANSQGGLATAPLQPFTSPVTWQLGSTAEITHTVYLRLVDAAGNTSMDLPATITLDRTPPSPAAAVLQGASVTNAATATITLTTDVASLSPGAGVTVSESPLFNGATPGPFPMTGTVTVPLTAPDGPRTFYVRFRDGAGNDAVTEVRVTRDTEAPTGSLAVRGTLGDGSFSSQFSTSANLSALVTTSGASEYQVLTSTSACPASGYAPLPSARVTVPVSGQGTWTLRLCLRDLAGNVGTFDADPITYDATPPSGCSLALTGAKVDGSPAPAGRTAQRSITAAFTCSAVPTQMVLSTGAVNCTNTEPLTWATWVASSSVFLGGGDGLTTVRACVRDAAGNVAAVTPGTITLDTTAPQPPAVSIAAGAAWLNLGTGVSTTMSGSAPGATEWAATEAPALPASFVGIASTIPITFSGAATHRVVTALFRDDVGNVSGLATDDIDIDLTAPPGTLSVRTPSGNTFTNSVSVDVTIDPASLDARDLFLVRGTGSPCSAADFATATAAPFTRTSTFLLSSGDGAKRICARLRDPAGNLSAILEQSVTLDTQPPSQPLITTAPAVRNLPNGATFPVAIDAAVTESNFARYEGVGGAIGAWTQLSATQATTSFSFTLVSSGAAPAGIDNTLRLRAVDLAGNLSPESSVTITTDIVAPPPVRLSQFGVDNHDDEATLYWEAPDAGDLVGYNVYYGRREGGWATTLPDGGPSYEGTFAVQGNSPFRVPVVATSTPLTGVGNGTFAYASVRPVDRAGNLGPFPSQPATVELELQPNPLSPSAIADVPLPPMTSSRKILVVGDRALVVGTECSTSTFKVTNAVVVEISLAGIASPFQSGALSAGTAPGVLGTSTFPVIAGVSCAGAVDVVLEGAFAFVAAGNTITAHRLIGGSLLPTPANQVASVTVGTTPLSALSVEGRRLFATSSGSTSTLYAFNLTTFFDGLPGQSLALIGSTAQPGSLQTISGLVSTRDTLLCTAGDTTVMGSWNQAPAWAAAPTALTLNGTINTAAVSYGAPAVSGNYLYLASRGLLVVRDLTNVWTGSTTSASLATTSLGEGRGLSVSADTLWVPELDTKTLRMLRATDIGNGVVDQLGTFRPALLNLNSNEGLTATASFGPYQLIATGGYSANNVSHLQVLEVATPTAMRATTRLATRGGIAELSGSFLVTSQASVVDLQSGTPSTVRQNFAVGTGFDCSPGDYDGVTDSALVDDFQVHARSSGAHLQVVNLRSPYGRMGAATRALSYGVTLSTPMRVVSVERWGSLLGLLEDRGAGGVWFEVLDLAQVLDHDETAGTRLSAAASLGAIRLGTFVSSGAPGSALMGDVKLVRGRAVVGLDEFNQNEADPSPGLYVIDLRPLFDDNAGTPMAVLATAPADGVRAVELSGGLAWLAAESGPVGSVEAWNIANALAEPPTAIPNTVVGRTLLAGHPEGLVVRGSWALASTAVNSSIQPGVFAWDVSVPATPRLLGSIPERSDNTTCVGSQSLRNSLVVDGNRLFFTSPSGTTIIELE